jgi:hypothetical protein
MTATNTPLGGPSTVFGNAWYMDSSPLFFDMSDAAYRTSIRFTQRGTRTVNMVKIQCNTGAGSAPTYTIGIQNDSTITPGQPDAAYITSANFVPVSGENTVGLSPSVALTDGKVYHIVVQWFSGTINASNYADMAKGSTPKMNIIPYDQFIDNNLAFMDYNGSAWTEEATSPLFELWFSDSTFEGNPFGGATTSMGVSGNGTFGDTSDDYVEGQIINPSADYDVSGFQTRAAWNNLSPADNLYYYLFDVTNNNTVVSGILATPAQLTGTIQWI